MPPSDMVMVWDKPALARLSDRPEAQAHMRLIGEDMAGELRDATPKASGGGARSIEARPSPKRDFVDVGWDKEHFYLIFPEFGTMFQGEQRFARDVLDRFTKDE